MYAIIYWIDEENKVYPELNLDNNSLKLFGTFKEARECADRREKSYNNFWKEFKGGIKKKEARVISVKPVKE